MFDIYTFLEANDIPYERYDHPAVFTCEESKRLCPEMPGMHTKNLFLRDEKGRRHILVVVSCETSVDLKELRIILKADKLSFASPDRLLKYLGVDPGSVTILGLVHDREHAVEVYIDEEIWNANAIQCHPLVNTVSLVIPHAGLEHFLRATGHTPVILSVPRRG